MPDSIYSYLVTPQTSGFNASQVPKTLTVVDQNDSSNIIQYSYEIEGNYSNVLFATVYFSLVNNLDPQNYNSYNIQMYFSKDDYNTFKAFSYSLISYLTYDEQKISGPILDLSTLPVSDSPFNISLLFPSYLLKANIIYRVNLEFINQNPNNYFLCNTTGLIPSNTKDVDGTGKINTGIQVKPTLFATNQSTTSSTQTPKLTNTFTAFQPFAVKTKYQVQTTINSATQYPSTPFGDVQYSNNVNFPYLNNVIYFKGGVVFVPNAFLLGNGDTENFLLSISNLPYALTSTPANIEYVCTITCIIDKTVKMSPVLFLPAIFNNSTKSFNISNINLTDFFPQLMTSPSLYCYVSIEGYLNTSSGTDIDHTIFSSWQFNRAWEGTKTIPSSPLAPLSTYFNYIIAKEPISAQTLQVPAIDWYVPVNTKSCTTGYAQLPRLSLGNRQNLSAYLKVFNSYQFMNAFPIYNVGFTTTNQLFLPTSVVIHMDFELLAPINDLLDQNDLIITVNGLSFGGPSNFQYLVNAEIASDGTSISVSENFFHLYGSSGTDGLQYVLLKQKDQGTSANNMYTTVYVNNGNFVTYNEYLPLSYQFGPVLVNNLLPLPVPNFNGNPQNSFYLTNLNDQVNDSGYVCCWIGYLNVREDFFWFSMYCRIVDDVFQVQILDKNNSTIRIVDKRFNLSASPQSFFYRFSDPGLYPIQILFQNVIGGGGLADLNMGFWGDKPENFSTLIADNTPYLDGTPLSGGLFNGTFPGIASSFPTMTTKKEIYFKDTVAGATIGYNLVRDLYTTSFYETPGGNSTIVNMPSPREQWNPLPANFKAPGISFNLTNLFQGVSYVPGKRYSVNIHLLRYT